MVLHRCMSSGRGHSCSAKCHAVRTRWTHNQPLVLLLHDGLCACVPLSTAVSDVCSAHCAPLQEVETNSSQRSGSLTKLSVKVHASEGPVGLITLHAVDCLSRGWLTGIHSIRYYCSTTYILVPRLTAQGHVAGIVSYQVLL